MSEPRETARQIAERIVWDWAHGWHGSLERREANPLIDAIVAAILTADLAQARQESEQWKAKQQGYESEADRLTALVVAAEQARDEARHERDDAESEYLSRLFRAQSSAARTALLEAAADMKQRHDTFLGIEIAQWLTTRAGGPRT